MEENMRKKKIAIINQRYGSEVNGGSEYYTKQLAEHLLPFYDVEVLTTTAKDYDTWKNFYPSGKTEVDGVSVLRFPVERERKKWRFRVANLLMRILPGFLRKKGEYGWIAEQGPYCPELVQYIQKNEKEYDTFLFMTYLYYPTAVGILQYPEKSILVPTAHDEYCIYFHYYRNVFQKPRGIVYLTEAEETFAESLFRNQKIPHVLAGSGIDVPQQVSVEETLKKYDIKDEYVIYVGRVSVGKGCGTLFPMFEQYKKEHKNELKLVVVGKMMMSQPVTTDVKCLGFISEEEKYALMAGARALILPSEFESLSLVVLESMASGVPVLVNGKCEVLKNHCEKSKAGFYYRDYSEFEQYLQRLITESPERTQMCTQGIEYVRENYSWKHTIEQYRRLIDENN